MLFRVNVGEWWFRSCGGVWYPGLYEWFFSKTRRGGALRTREEIVYGMFSIVLEPYHSLVEFGSGTGSYTVPLARRCNGMVTVAVSGEMNGSLRKLLLREVLINVKIRSGWLEDDVYETEKFDGALVG